MLKDRRRGNSETRASCSETSVAWTGAFLILCTFFLCTLCSVSRIFILNFMRNYKEKSVANNECAWSDPVETKCRDITLAAFCDWWSDCSYLGFIWKLILCEAPSHYLEREELSRMDVIRSFQTRRNISLNGEANASGEVHICIVRCACLVPSFTVPPPIMPRWHCIILFRVAVTYFHFFRNFS